MPHRRSVFKDLRPARSPPHITTYIDRVLALPGVKVWLDAALLEHDFRD
jgi:hypothetical protein